MCVFGWGGLKVGGQTVWVKVLSEASHGEKIRNVSLSNKITTESKRSSFSRQLLVVNSFIIINTNVPAFAHSLTFYLMTDSVIINQPAPHPSDEPGHIQAQ